MHISQLLSPFWRNCPDGYMSVDGLLSSFGTCKSSASESHCVLPPSMAFFVCDRTPECCGVSETSSRQWQRQFPGLYQLGACKARVNANWRTCRRVRALLEPSLKVHDAAVCLSGTPRNVGRRVPPRLKHWPDRKNLRASAEQQTAFYSSVMTHFSGNFTVADTVQHFLYPSLGNFDVFMYVPTRFDGSLGRVRAERACGFYAPWRDSNRLFCAGGPDLPMNGSNFYMARMVWQYWETFSSWPFLKFVMQMRGHAACSAMILDVENRERIQYKWIVRLRADYAFFSPFPNLSQLDYDESKIFSYSGDQFAVGPATAMHGFLNRLWDLNRMLQIYRHTGLLNFLPGGYTELWTRSVLGGEHRRLQGEFAKSFRATELRWKDPHDFPTTAPLARPANLRWHAALE